MVTGDGVRAGIARSLSVTASISNPCPCVGVLSEDHRLLVAVLVKLGEGAPGATDSPGYPLSTFSF